MKIEGGRPNTGALGNTRVDRSSVDRSTNTGRRADSRGGSVRLPSDARLVSAAVSAVRFAPSIRQDKVEAARRTVEAGRIARDPYSLADKLIDSLLER
jgi:anti-sigma28 factor (negative regulator of flagellin synthesis)